MFSLEYKRGFASNSGNGWPGPNLFEPSSIFGKFFIRIFFYDSLFFVPQDLGMRKRSSWSTFFNKNKVKRQHGHFNDDLQMAEYL